MNGDSASDRLHVVLCQKSTGLLVPFNSYLTHAEAAMVASRLSSLGCTSHVAFMPNQELSPDSQAQVRREPD